MKSDRRDKNKEEENKKQETKYKVQQGGNGSM